MAIKFLSINTKGLNHPVKRKSLWKEALTNKCDILCDILSAQETHFCNVSTPLCKHRNFPYTFSANAESKSRGVITAIRDSVAFILHTEYKDPQGPNPCM